MLDDEHRGLVDHAIEAPDEGVERLRAAGRGSHQESARRLRRERTQLDRRAFGGRLRGMIAKMLGASLATLIAGPRRRDAAGPCAQLGKTPAAVAERQDFLDEVVA